jgi:Fe-S oxidoreductase
MSKIVRLAKKYLDVEIKDNHWECPDCKSMIKISDVSIKSAMIKSHFKSNKHQKTLSDHKIEEL